MAALDRPCAISRSTSISRGVSWSSADAGASRRRPTSASSSTGSTTDPPRHVSAQRVDELGAVADPLLEQIGQPVGAVPEQLERVPLLGVLGQHHDADPRVGRADRVRRPDPFGAVVRRHPDVGQHRVGPQPLHRVEELLGGAARRRHRHLAGGLQQLARALADQVGVLREDHPQLSPARPEAGRTPRSVVPAPGPLVTDSDPPAAASRSRRPTRPDPSADGALNPRPVSCTATVSAPPSADSSTRADVLPECLSTLARPSSTRK